MNSSRVSWRYVCKFYEITHLRDEAARLHLWFPNVDTLTKEKLIDDLSLLSQAKQHPLSFVSIVCCRVVCGRMMSECIVNKMPVCWYPKMSFLTLRVYAVRITRLFWLIRLRLPFPSHHEILQLQFQLDGIGRLSLNFGIRYVRR